MARIRILCKNVLRHFNHKVALKTNLFHLQPLPLVKACKSNARSKTCKVHSVIRRLYNYRKKNEISRFIKHKYNFIM